MEAITIIIHNNLLYSNTGISTETIQPLNNEKESVSQLFGTSMHLRWQLNTADTAVNF